MRTVTTAPGDIVLIGRQGENKACQVQIDVSGWAELYGEGHFELLHQRPGETFSYPVDFKMDGETILWTVTDTDTEIAGRDGLAELDYYVGDALAKSAFIHTRVLDALDVSGKKPPMPGQNWYHMICEALQSKVSINQGAEHSGMLLYVDGNGNVALLKLGAGLKIVDGVLTLSGAAPKLEAPIIEVIKQLDSPVIRLSETTAVLGKAILGEMILGDNSAVEKLATPTIYLDVDKLSTPIIQLVEG